MLEDYLVRLSRVLRQPVPEISRQAPPRLPEVRELQLVIEPPAIDLLEFWAFRKCGLALILGERNSVLGRVMQPSQALHMDGRILRQLSVCERDLQDEEMLRLARQLRTEKYKQWPLRYWNGTVAAPEMRQFWSAASEPLTVNEQESFAAVHSALMFLTDLPGRLSGESWPSLATMEGHYQQLDRFELGGRLLRSLQLASDYLSGANAMLEAAVSDRSLCPSGLQRRELDYARNVMVKVFVGDIQPWLAKLNRHASGLFVQYDRLIAAQAEPLQSRVKPFQESIERLLSDFHEQNRAHVQLWQALFEACGSRAIEQ